ncbi:MAG: hypothetical protein COA37_15520 [Hoeflea sp.]|uniref:hypothetical protein n=1 Tax=Hoeflea sp. TaxID=1940281 RepID=UPI000C0D5F2D|nr:hypothetical protein [Hoeflea sp.]PHR20342.1 MAG: hypothetical protein COA37_15520 [Hoeflea sp.]
MKPQISLIEGLHLTATDKCNILACIEYQRDQHPATWGVDWLGRKASPKRYTVAPVPETPNRYEVRIRENYRNDYGCPCERTARVVIETKGVDPLPDAQTHPAWNCDDLFSAMPREPEA